MFTPSFFTPSYYSMLSPLAPSAPSSAPSLVEGTSSVEPAAPSSVEPEMQDEQESFESRVSIEPFVVQFIGDFELTNDAEMIIINVINELISPYLEMEVGDILKYIGMELEFLEDNDRANSGGQRRRLSSIDLLQVKGSLDLQGTSQDQMNAWTEQKVTSTVRNFFSVTHLVEKLLDTLVNKGLNLNDIAIDNGNAGSIVTEEMSSKQSTNNSTSSEGSSFADYIQDETVLLIAGICGGVVCMILAVGLVVKIRIQWSKKFKGVRRFTYKSGNAGSFNQKSGKVRRFKMPRIQWREKFGKVRRSMRKSGDTDTLNLRSGHDDLPDCNASIASSHVSFPDVLGDAPENAKSNDNIAAERYADAAASGDCDISLGELLGDDERSHSDTGASDSDISLGELLGDYDDIELNDIEDGVSSYKGNRSSTKKGYLYK
jgi:hypothetical protein